jgi:hypothetical protein
VAVIVEAVIIAQEKSRRQAAINAGFDFGSIKSEDRRWFYRLRAIRPPNAVAYRDRTIFRMVGLDFDISDRPSGTADVGKQR